jgi:hypothetical protein
MSSAQPLFREPTQDRNPGLNDYWDKSQSGGDIDTLLSRIETTVLSGIGNINESEYARQTEALHGATRQGVVMDGTGQEIIRDLKRLRKWKDWLQREHDRMRKEIDTLKVTSADQEAEIKRGKESYRALLDEKVALKEQLLVSDP